MYATILGVKQRFVSMLLDWWDGPIAKIGIVLTTLAFVSKWVGTGKFWLHVTQWSWSRIGWLKTDLGRLCLLIVGIAFLVWNQYRIRRPKPHDLKTLRGRTLRLRDDLQQFLDGIGQSEKTTKRPDETVSEFIKRSSEVIMPRVYKIVHGYELGFPPRVERIYHEFGERGVNDVQLAGLMGRPYRNEEAVNEIIKELSELSDLPVARE